MLGPDANQERFMNIMNVGRLCRFSGHRRGLRLKCSLATYLNTTVDRLGSRSGSLDATIPLMPVQDGPRIRVAVLIERAKEQGCELRVSTN